MVQAYHGYFQNGRFISAELNIIPDNTEAYVMITGKEIPPAKTKPQRQLEAFDKFVAAVRSANGESFTEKDFAELENNRASIAREVTL
jgi:hypothetical protein